MNTNSDRIKLNIEGTFTNSGFLPGGFFEGHYSYDPDTPDTNPNVVNVGVFEVPDFEIRIFDSQFNLVDTLNEQNSNASVILSDLSALIPGADQYQFSTTQDTEAIPNAFFEYGSIDLTFDWSSGGSTTSAPVLAPKTFQDGIFASYTVTDSWDSFINPQSVQDAEILPIHEPPSDNLILYRVNVGGGLLTSADASISDWSEDTDTNLSPFRIGSGGANIYTTSNAINLSDPSLPASTPEAIFQSERWDPSSGENMQWEFPVDSGNEVEVRLYFAEIYESIIAPNQRVFDISVEGVIPTVFDDVDQYEIAGQFSGFMLSHSVTVDDSSLSLEFLGNIQNPALKGIEILSSQVPDEVAPTITTSVTILENQTAVLNVESVDANGDIEGSGLTYSLTGGVDQSLFAINAKTGDLSFQTTPDFEAPGDSDGDNIYVVDVTVTDSTDLTDTQTLNVTVTDVDETDPVIGLDVRLYDAVRDTLIIPLSDGQQISASEVEGKSLTVTALVPEDSIYFGQVESIFLNLNNGQVTQTENVEPYALFGDSSGDFYGGTIPQVDNTINFELYSQNNLGGDLLDTVIIDFSILELVELR